MRKLEFAALLFVLCFPFIQAHSQDIIKKKNGDLIRAKIHNINLDNVFYKPYDDLAADTISIPKTDVTEIKFENGKTEHFDQPAPTGERSIEETKQFILEEINKHGFDANTFKRRYVASFEGDFLRLTVLSRNGNFTYDTALYDFSNVYRFSGIDRRSDSVAYINMYVAYLFNSKRNQWKKDKITILVDSDIKAESLFNAFKHYNSLLIKKEKGDSKF